MTLADFETAAIALFRATDTDGNPTGTVNLTVYTPELSSNFVSPTATQCAVKVIDQQIKGGSMWAEFNCAQLTAPPSGLCGVNSSYIVFENCSGS